MSCAYCDSMNKSAKNEIKKILDGKVFNSGVYIVLSYLSFNDIVALHSYRDKDNIKHHYICSKCFNNLRNIANICDTNIITCPVCPRNIFI